MFENENLTGKYSQPVLGIISLFPEMFIPWMSLGVLSKVFSSPEICNFSVNLINLRDFGEGPHKIVDGRPCGGGPGMVLRADVLDNAMQTFLEKQGSDSLIFCLSPRGTPWNESQCVFWHEQLFPEGRLAKSCLFICGRYEGIDERLLSCYDPIYLSVGDFILTGGEVALMAILESILRKIPQVLGDSNSALQDSFGQYKKGLLDHPVYTRPLDFKGLQVPEILFSGHHQQIESFREKQSLEVTRRYRPDIYTS